MSFYLTRSKDNAKLFWYNKMQQFIRKAIERELQPRTTGSQSIVLRDNKEYKVLVNTAGLTKAGRLYEQLAGSDLGSTTFDKNQTPPRESNTEYISMKGGKDKEVRRYDPATQEYVYTKLGKQFFKNTRREYVVKVPTSSI